MTTEPVARSTGPSLIFSWQVPMPAGECPFVIPVGANTEVALQLDWSVAPDARIGYRVAQRIGGSALWATIQPRRKLCSNPEVEYGRILGHGGVMLSFEDLLPSDLRIVLDVEDYGHDHTCSGRIACYAELSHRAPSNEQLERLVEARGGRIVWP